MKKYKMLIAAVLLFTAAAAAGYAYVSRMDDFDALSTYVNGFFSGARQYDRTAVLIAAVKANLLLWLMITGGAVIKIGMVLPAAALVRRGFLTGFTASAMCRIYAEKGMLIMLAQLPKNIVMIPLMIIYACCCVGFAFDRERGIARFAVISAAAAVIFVLCAIIEGYVSMPLIYTFVQKLF